MVHRRTMLKAVSAGVVTERVGLRNATARSDDAERVRNDMKRAGEIHNRDGLEAERAFLENEEYDYVIKESTALVSLGNNNEEKSNNAVDLDSIEDPRDGGIVFTMYGIKDRNSDIYTVRLNVDYNFEVDWYGGSWGACKWDGISSGDDPRDGAGLFYKHNGNFWQLATGNANQDILTRRHSDFDEAASMFADGAIGYRFDDKSAYADWIDSIENDVDCPGDDQSFSARRDAGSIGVMLRPSGDYSESERVVYGVYTHAYKMYGISPSLSLGLPPTVSIDVTGYVSTVEIQTDENGNVLNIYQEEMV